LSVLARDEDKICVISCDEEDGDSGHGERSREVHDSLSGLHACATNAENDITILRYLNLFGGFLGETGNDWCEDILCPSCVADDGTFDWCYADVQESVFIVD
jgi:hypothetical protein